MTAPSPAAPASSAWVSRLRGIEGLRAGAALAVLVAHAGREMTDELTSDQPFSQITWLRHGLTLFFVLSGFLLYRPFCAALLAGRRRPDLGRYAASRALRIVPAYLVVLVLVSTVLQTAALPSDEVEAVHQNSGALSPGLLGLNATMLQNLVPGTQRTGISVAWSLTTELTFYLALPLVAGIGALCVRWAGRSGAALVPPLLLLAVGLTSRTVSAVLTAGLDEQARFEMLWGFTWTGVLARSLIGQADLFALGMLAAWVLCRAEATPAWAGWLVRLRGAAWGALLLAVAASTLDSLTTWADTAAGVGCVALLLLVVVPARTGRPGWLTRVLDTRPLVGLGLVSYSVYLWHVPLMWWLLRQGVELPQTPAGLVLAIGLLVGVTLLVAVPTYLLVERPALRLKSRGRPRPPATPSTTDPALSIQAAPLPTGAHR